jgi:hypothetical protein
MALHATSDIILAAGLTNQNKQPYLVTSTGASSITVPTTNVMFYNYGGTVVVITVNGVANNVPTGVTLTFDAGGSDNKFPPGKFSWDATGGTLHISYVA